MKLSPRMQYALIRVASRSRGKGAQGLRLDRRYGVRLDTLRALARRGLIRLGFSAFGQRRAYRLTPAGAKTLTDFIRNDV